jgi:glycosyltransferase involved in cell wall biosynthesis
MNALVTPQAENARRILIDSEHSHAAIRSLERRRMKVAIATAFPVNPSRPHGGVEAVSVNLVRAMAKRPDMDVHVVTFCDGVAEARVEAWEGASITRLPVVRGPLLWNAVHRYRRQIQDWVAGQKPEVVHAHDTYGMMVQGLALPRVFTIHGFIHEDTRYAGGLSSWFRSQLWKKFEIGCWAEQPHIVAISPYVRERLRGIARGAIHDIENPISEECFDVPARRGQRIIFSAAVVCQRKNTLGLLKAFAALLKKTQPAQLRLAGPMAEPDYAILVKDFIRSAGLEKNVVLLGSLTTQQVRAELAQADAFALLSYEEGAPMGIAEALAAGVPIVTSNRCGMPYMVRHGETGFLVSPDNPEAAADAFYRVLDEPDLGGLMGRRCRAFALDCYHPDLVAGRTCLVYRQAVQEFSGQ